MIDFSQAHTWNKCPRCGHPVPPNEWASYMRCEDCWAGSIYNPPKQSTVVSKAKNRDARRGRVQSGDHQ